MTIGVIANTDELSFNAQRRSALLGLQTGAYTVLGSELPPLAMIICDGTESRREEALEVFRTYGVKTVVAQPLASSTIPEDLTYISIGLDDQLTDDSPLGSPAPGWLNLRPPREELQSAIEYLSSLLVERISEYDTLFSVLLSNRTQESRANFIQNLIWRLSPYSTSPFRTLVVSYENSFSIDEDIKVFLQGDGPLGFFVSPEPSSTLTLTKLVQDVSSIYIDRTSLRPLSLLSMMWDVGQSGQIQQAIWPSIIRYSVIYGQYSLYHHDPSSQDFNKLLPMHEEAFTNATVFDRLQTLPSPYFGLAFDAGVLSALIYQLSMTGENLHTILSDLQAEGNESNTVHFTSEQINQQFKSYSLSDLEDWRSSNKVLMGLSGVIKNVKSSEDLRLAPMVLCRFNQEPPVLFPLERLSAPERLDEQQAIYDHFTIDLSMLSRCEQP